MEALEAIALDADSTVDGAPIRAELVAKVLQLLSDDAERGDGELSRADIDRTYLRKGLTIEECCEVEGGLARNDVRIIEDDDEDEDDDEGNTQNDTKTFGTLRIGSKSYLTEVEEREMGRKIQLASRVATDRTTTGSVYERLILNQGQKARSRLVETNIRYVWKLARELGTRLHLTTEDLFQEGILGLLRATEKFDPEIGFRFKTYATWWVRQSMHRALDNTERTVRLPVHVAEQYRRIRRAESRLNAELGRPPTTKEVATTVGIDPERLIKLFWRVYATNVAEADAPIGDDDTTIVSLKADDSTPSAFDNVSHSELRSTVAQLLRELNDREAKILAMRFGLDGGPGLTLEAIGQIYNVTRERIRQIEAKALRKLAHPVRKARLASFLD